MQESKRRDAVLVVDDNLVNLQLLRRRLAHAGYRVLTAENGKTALSLVKSEDIQLVLLDVMMPDMDGYEVLARIRETHPVSMLPVIMVTALDQSADIVRALELGANDFMTKPVDFSVALARINTHLFLKFQKQLLNALAQTQAMFIATSDPDRVFNHLLDALLTLTHSEFGFIGEILYPAPEQTILKIYADNWRGPDFLKNISGHPRFLHTLMQSGTTLKRDLSEKSHESAALFEGAAPLQHIALYPLSSNAEHLGIAGFANRPGGYGPDMSEQLAPVWNTCSSLFVALKNERRRLEIEQALKESEQRIRSILNAAVDGILAIDEMGQIALFNPAAEKIFGYTTGELIGKKVPLLMPMAYGEAFESDIDQYLSTGKSDFIGQSLEIIGERKNGEVFPMNLSLSEMILQNRSVFIAIVRDITEQKRTNEQIRFQNTLMECQSNASLDGILVVDSSRHWLFTNRKFLEIWDLPPDMPVRQKSDEAIQKIISKVENSQEFSQKIQYLYSHPHESSHDEIALKDGRILERYSAPVESEDGIFYGRVWFYRDITRRKTAETALADAREREIEIGSRIQQTLLFGQQPKGLTGIEVATFSLPSQRIAGDFYDFYVHSDHCLDIIVGDVMGKGIPAALVGAGTKSRFSDAFRRLVVIAEDRVMPSPEEIVSLVHAEITGDLSTLETFVTTCYTRIDRSEMRLYFVDCGHTKTVHYCAQLGRCETLQGDNMPLGFFESEIYRQFSAPIGPGDVLFFYSDGLTEAPNPAGEYFGEARVIDIVQAHHEHAPEELVLTACDAATAFSAATDFADDLTCVAVKIT